MAGNARTSAGTGRCREDAEPWRRNVVMRTLVQCFVMSPPVRTVPELSMYPDHTPQGLHDMPTHRRRKRRERFDYREKRLSHNPVPRHRLRAKMTGIPAAGRAFLYCGAAIFFGGILWGVWVCRVAPTKQRFFASARAASSLVTSSLARSLSRNRPPLSPGICL